jgi:hypothetical protein
MLAHALTGPETNIASGFDREIQTAAFRRRIQHVASSVGQLWSTAFASQNSDDERPRVSSRVNPLAVHGTEINRKAFADKALRAFRRRDAHLQPRFFGFVIQGRLLAQLFSERCAACFSELTRGKLVRTEL